MIFRSAYARRDRLSVDVVGPSLTKQSFKDQCDINRIMRRYSAGGQIDHLAKRDAFSVISLRLIYRMRFNYSCVLMLASLVSMLESASGSRMILSSFYNSFHRQTTRLRLSSWD